MFTALTAAAAASDAFVATFAALLTALTASAAAWDASAAAVALVAAALAALATPEHTPIRLADGCTLDQHTTAYTA